MRENEVEMTVEELRKAAMRFLPQAKRGEIKEKGGDGKSMEIYADEMRVRSLPQLTPEERYRMACRNMVRFRWDKHYEFWRNVYIHYRDELYPGRKKAGKHEATRSPADNGNHDDGKPAA